MFVRVVSHTSCGAAKPDADYARATDTVTLPNPVKPFTISGCEGTLHTDSASAICVPCNVRCLIIKSAFS